MSLNKAVQSIMEAEDQRILEIMGDFVNNGHKFKRLVLPGKNRIIEVCPCGLRIRIYPGSRKKVRKFDECILVSTRKIHES